jgi:hypothetical protein
MISEPESQKDGTWVVHTSHGPKVFSDGETAEDFYILNRHRETQQQHGNSSSPR